MKKGNLLSFINETVEKIRPVSMNEDSFYDGHKFTAYGKNIDDIYLIMPSNDDLIEYSINKKSLVLNWMAKFQFTNSGVYDVTVGVIDLNAEITKTISYDDSYKTDTEVVDIDFKEFEFQATTEKDCENKSFGMYVTSVEIDVEQKIVKVVITI